MNLRIELSTDTVDGAVTADELGADRIELCSAGELGGLTPGPGLLAAVLARCHRAEVHVLIRPREGGFRYTPSEVDAMLTDVRHAAISGAAGVVVGALTARNELDRAVLADLVAAADGLPVTVHRAIDVSADPVTAVEALVPLGVRRVLSSGGAARAEDGVPVLRRMVAAAGDALAVMACGGIRPHNALAIARATGVRDLHAAPRRRLPPPPPSAVDYGTYAVLDEEAAGALVALARSAEG
ncbi:copper homeostasis protein [Amycolatopsis sacchari]|uniref:PF03932 family protein CutC n=1 Tax=Amycolatopsis sacchari TaxID=115433 RepID=A0A1I3LT64_9PSEU|nr:copper homeostasis protein CutC [Amycolatopsis sacchari]SFI87646.1 copper homeostasis protein [Amycolatopsis sacchari]